MSNPTRPWTALGFALALAAGGAAGAAEPPRDTNSPTAPTAAAVDNAAPAPAELEHPIALRDDEALTVIVNPDGSRMLLHDASFLATTVAKIGPDGRLVIGCVSSRQEYDAFFAAEALPDGAEVR